jgi:hypothetical protein
MGFHMDDIVTLRLSRLAVGQMLDGLDERMQSWRATAEYMDTGESPEGIVINECTNEHEATAIANLYEEIIDSIRAQMNGKRMNE